MSGECDKCVEHCLDCKCPNYSIEVYDDCAIITGWLSSDILQMLIKLCEKEGFTHLAAHEGFGFKLVKKDG